jgi:hypothetical protein
MKFRDLADFSSGRLLRVMGLNFFQNEGAKLRYFQGWDRYILRNIPLNPLKGTLELTIDD